MIINRTKNSIYNTLWGFIQRFVSLLGPFAVRTVLIYKLSAEYSGLNNLFSSILSILSLTELGFSNAIVYSMYKPIAENDIETICALLNLYRKVYKVVGMVILAAGVLLMPFLRFLIKGTIPPDINIYILYAIFLLNTAMSYLLFAYKTSILSAFQREDVISRNMSVCNLLMYIAQISVILVFHNYYIYVILLPLFTVLINVVNSKSVKRMYPELVCRGTVSAQMKQSIKKRLSGIIIWKVGGATRNTLDSIVVSAYLGLTMVTVYNNYYYIVSALLSLFAILTNAITAGVGNKIETSTPEENYKDFSKFNLVYVWLAGWAMTCMLCLYQPFMRLWMGEKMMLEALPMILLCIYFFILKLGDINSVYYQAAGLWWEGRYRSLIEAALNLALNLSLGYYFGVTGIILATIISMLCVWFYGSGIVFWKYFTGHKAREFYATTLVYVLITACTAFITYLACSFVPEGVGRRGTFIEIVIKFAVCMLSNIMFWLMYRRTCWYGDAKELVSSILEQVKKKLLVNTER